LASIADARAFRDVLERGQVREQFEALEHHAHLLPDRTKRPRIAGQARAFELDRAAVDRLETVRAPEEGRFARTRRSDQAHDFAGVHVQIDPA